MNRNALEIPCENGVFDDVDLELENFEVVNHKTKLSPARCGVLIIIKLVQ